MEMAPRRWTKECRPLKERFLEKVAFEPNSGCWLWTGSTTGGYGRIGVGSRSDGTRKCESAARVAMELFRETPPRDLEVLHKCDNKLCVNPDHLYIGTHQQNMSDAWVRGQKQMTPAWRQAIIDSNKRRAKRWR